MNIHKNARLTPLPREEMARAVVEGRLSKAAAARTYGVTAKIVARWVERFLSQGPAGMADRSSRPKRSPAQTPATIADEIAALRRRVGDAPLRQSELPMRPRKSTEAVLSIAGAAMRWGPLVSKIDDRRVRHLVLE